MCAKPTVTNGVVSPGDATVGVGEAYSVACNAGYSHASGDMTCQAGETFVATVTCVPGCALPVGPN